MSTKEEEREFWEQAKDAQEEVASWPAWKRGAAARARVTPEEAGATAVGNDDHKDARQDAAHALRYPTSPHGGDAIFKNLARCYLALVDDVKRQREEAAAESAHRVRCMYTNAWRAAGGGETESQMWFLPSDIEGALARIRSERDEEDTGEPQEAGAEDRTKPHPMLEVHGDDNHGWGWDPVESSQLPCCWTRDEALAQSRAFVDSITAPVRTELAAMTRERDSILLSHNFAAEQANKWAERAEKAEAERDDLRAQLATVTRERDDWRRSSEQAAYRATKAEHERDASNANALRLLQERDEALRLLDEQSRLAEQHRLNHAFAADNAERCRAERDEVWDKAFARGAAVADVAWCSALGMRQGEESIADALARRDAEAHARGVAEGERLGAARALQEAADIWARSNGTLGLPDNRGVDGWLRFRASLVAADRAENAEGALSDYVRAAQAEALEALLELGCGACGVLMSECGMCKDIRERAASLRKGRGT